MYRVGALGGLFHFFTVGFNDWALCKMIFSKNKFLVCSAMAVLAFAGCKGMTQPGERAARKQLAAESKSVSSRKQSPRPAPSHDELATE